jgi:osmoprotectant transport system permease protein
MLELTGIYKSFGNKNVLNNITLTVPTGSTHALIGSSGSGKSTLLRIALGLIPYDKGSVKINDVSLESAGQKWNSLIGYVPQDGGLFPHLTGMENITLVSRLRGKSAQEISKRVLELQNIVGLEGDVFNLYPSEMSGGQKQRISIIRALMLDPHVILLDEPMGALDPLKRSGLQKELKIIFERLKKTVLIVTHDLSEAAFLSDKMSLLHDSQIIQSGTFKQFQENPTTPFVTSFLSAYRSLLLLLIIFTSITGFASEQIVVASKTFTESYILGEIAAKTVESSTPVMVNRKLGMGATGMLLESLRVGEVDIYPDYTGTLSEILLKRPDLRSHDEIKTELLNRGIIISASLGFNNTYALAVTKAFAKEHGLNKISDLKKIELKLIAAFSYEFMDRADGYRGLIKSYNLNPPSSLISRMEHSLSYEAISNGSANVIDVYSTDAKIEKLNLKVLEDDLSYFPAYEAVWVARKEFVDKYPAVWMNLSKLKGSITPEMMIHMNSEADLEKQSFKNIASAFLGNKIDETDHTYERIWLRTKEHLVLVGSALLFSFLVGIPLGILTGKSRQLGHIILTMSAVIQTIPSLALLCFLIPIFGIGTFPALVALCLYSLLPVVTNTSEGIRGIAQSHLENAKALGLSSFESLHKIILPLAAPLILAGLKTATLVTIGTATLAALIGAGGYGAEIVTGLALNDNTTILQGAIPAALMALATQVLFAIIESLVISKGLRKKS